jgi:fatty acid desaturase
MEAIRSEDIRRQAFKFYLVLFAWPAYLFLIPWAYHRFGYPALALILFPGIYLFTWLAFLMHECWHKYVPQLPNKLFYRLFSWMLLTDHQIYWLVHGHHHSEVNTWEDREFHPLGEIKNRAWRRIYNFLEIACGWAFLVVVTSWAIPRLPKYRKRYRFTNLLISICFWVLIVGGLGLLSSQVFRLSTAEVLVPYLLSYFLGSVILHHSQLIEHGNLALEGTWEQRNLKTRNLRNKTLGEKLFLFLTHHDSHEHVLHHTSPRLYTRPFVGRVPLPSETVVISLREYAGVLKDMLLARRSTPLPGEVEPPVRPGGIEVEKKEATGGLTQASDPGA